LWSGAHESGGIVLIGKGMQAHAQSTFSGTLECLQGSGSTAHIVAVVCAFALLGLIWMPIAFWLASKPRRMVEPRRRAEIDLLRSARRDTLTQLQNRAGFSEALTRRLKSGTRSALLLVDIDRFKAINSTYGHRTGDEVLVAVASRLRQLVPEADQTARLGGDEFAILLDVARGGRDDVEGAALNLLRAMLQPMSAGMQNVECKVSIGIAMTPDHALDEDNIMRAAHMALDEMKASGGGSFRFYSPANNAAEQVRQEMRGDLKTAIEVGQIIPYYQPIVDLRTGVMIGLEVLARWQHPERGLLSPDKFIPLAEEMHLAGQITQALMRRVVRDARDWPSWMYFALNVSPGQLREMIGMLRNPPVWPEGELDPKRLEIEVTESALIEDTEVAREMISLLQARGTRVVLDDFGNGYSNIFHLRELPFDRIKIDKSFVMDSGKDTRAEACIRAMLALGASLGIEMVAEGIESNEVAAHLAQLGCRYGQGYLYSEPVPASAVFTLMRRLRQGQAEAVA
jgi:diguanylate cyclase (GGDEF)-like protein